MKILVTGATGFLGSHLCELFHAEGLEVVGVARDRAQLGCATELAERMAFVELAGLQASLRSTRFDAVAHAATAYGRSGESALSALVDANVAFPLRVLEACRNQNPDCRFLNTDSFFSKPGNSSEYMPAYAQSKRQLREWLQRVDRGVVNLRVEHVYGPRDRPPKFVPWLLAGLATGKPLRLTAAEQYRDFVHVEDVARAFLAVLRAPIQDGFLEYQVGTGTAVQVRLFVEEARRAAGSSSELQFGAIPPRAGEIEYSVADISALADLGWKPSITYVDGLASYAAHRHVEYSKR